MMQDDPVEGVKPKRRVPMATPEMLEARMKALEELQKLNVYADIEDPVAWQREIRKDRPLPFRD
jgi:ribosomal protein L13